MERREILRKLFFGIKSVQNVLKTPPNDKLTTYSPNTDSTHSFDLDWQNWPNMRWLGDEIVTQEVENWHIQKGLLATLTSDEEVMATFAKYQLQANGKDFRAQLSFRFANEIDDPKNAYIGFKIHEQNNGDNDKFTKTDELGISAGISAEGSLFFGSSVSHRKDISEKLKEFVFLQLSYKELTDGSTFAKLSLKDSAGNTLATFSTKNFEAKEWKGSIGIVACCQSTSKLVKNEFLKIQNCRLEGERLLHLPLMEVNPILQTSTQLQQNRLSVSAKFAPVNVDDSKAVLLILQQDNWKKIMEEKINTNTLTAHFNLDDWASLQTNQCKVGCEIRLHNGETKRYTCKPIVPASEI